MVKFEFKLDDIEAENLVDILRNEVNDNRHKAVCEEVTDRSYSKWCTKHADYIEEEIINPILEGSSYSESRETVVKSKYST